MRVLVTGGRGFLGRRVLGLGGQHEILSLERSTASPRPGIRTLVGDLARPASWQSAAAEFAPECCIHLAWDGLPDYSLAKCQQNLDTNVGLIEALTALKVPRLVVSGTCWEYGLTEGRQQEDARPGDLSVFAATKHAIRLVLDSAYRDAGLQYRWARVFFAYGAGQRPQSLIPYLRDCIKAGTTPTFREPGAAQDFVLVDDVARGLWALAECSGPSGTFNLGSGTPTTVGEIANLVAGHYGREPWLAPGPPVSGIWADTSKARTVAGWQPAIGIRDGVASTLTALDATA